MLYVGLGVVAFVIAGLLDLASLRGWRMAKPIIGLATVGLWVYAFMGLLSSSERFELELPLIILGWVIVVLASALTLLSQFRDIPFSKTYVENGVGEKLITTGTYALCRHPGVLWFGMLLFGLVLVTRAELVLIATPLWFVGDVLLVLVQDRVSFPRMFPAYPEYQEATPFLVPTAKSMRAYWHGTRSALYKLKESGEPASLSPFSALARLRASEAGEVRFGEEGPVAAADEHDDIGPKSARSEPLSDEGAA
jgi:protein-S-isoprenylcysteine O-methyltransferase Ste14